MVNGNQIDNQKNISIKRRFQSEESMFSEEDYKFKLSKIQFWKIPEKAFPPGIFPLLLSGFQ